MTFWHRRGLENGVETFVVGVELVSALRESEAGFLDIVQKVRAVYSGRVTYSANWDERPSDTVWRAMDEVSVQFYPPLTNVDAVPDDVLRRTARRHLAAWVATADRVGKPLVLSEVGYLASPIAWRRPWEWPKRLPLHQQVEDQKQQERGCRALFSALASEPKVKGVYIWKYFSDPKTRIEVENGFTPRGKPAELILCEAFGGACGARSP